MRRFAFLTRRAVQSALADVLVLDNLTSCCVIHTELLTTLADAKPVIALTALDDELYIARSSSHDIDVFDVESFRLLRRLTVTSVQRTLLAVVSFGRAPGFDITDMASCRLHHCLYVADGRSGVVRRLDRRNAKQVTQWSVAGTSLSGLSVSSAFNVLVFCCDSLSVRIYTPLGCPVCEISVQRPGVVGLVHGVQLDCGSFVVIGVTESGNRLAFIYRNNADVTDLIDSSGCPSHVALVGGRDGGSRVWLAERGVGAGVRMLEVPSSQCSAKLPTVQVEEPEKLCWNENGKRLYVVDGGRVKVFRVQANVDTC